MVPLPCASWGREELCQPVKPSSNPGSFSYQLCEFQCLAPYFALVIIQDGSLLHELELGKFEMMQHGNIFKISFVH